jgi:phosphinothricin acetyltransferase
MNVTVRAMEPGDGPAVMTIFNHYIDNSFSAYLENTLPESFFANLLGMCRGYPTAAAISETGELAGFGMLRPYSPIPAFSRTAEISYFVRPGFTGRGIGKTMLDHLISRARETGLECILAGISSLNEGSIRFHLKNGFRRCGEFRGIGRKHGVVFDVVYCQLALNP